MSADAGGGGRSGGSPDRLMRDHPQGVILTVMVTPRAVRSEVAGPHGTYLRVRIAAPDVGGRANQAAVRLLSRTFGCRVDMLSGAKSRIKRMLLRGADPDAVAAVLQGAPITCERGNPATFTASSDAGGG